LLTPLMINGPTLAEGGGLRSLLVYLCCHLVYLFYHGPPDAKIAGLDPPCLLRGINRRIKSRTISANSGLLARRPSVDHSPEWPVAHPTRAIRPTSKDKERVFGGDELTL